MSEDFQTEDNAEKLIESSSEVIIEYLAEHGAISKKHLISLLIEKCDLSRDEAEKIFEEHLEKRKIRYSKGKGGYVWSYSPSPRIHTPRFSSPKFPPMHKARARLETVLKLPPDPHMLPVQSHFLARDNPSHLYYHPAMDQDKLAYLRAKEKMGAGADWPA
jgi:predicted CopG family antitoxin